MLLLLNWEWEENLCTSFLLLCFSSSLLLWCSIFYILLHVPGYEEEILKDIIIAKSLITCCCSSCCTLEEDIWNIGCWDWVKSVWDKQCSMEEIYNNNSNKKNKKVKMLRIQFFYLEQGPVTAAPSERMRSPLAMSLVATRPLPAPGIEVTL